MPIRRLHNIRLRWIAALFMLAAQPLHAQSAGTARINVSRITVSGSSLLYPMVNDMARRFEAEHANVKIDVRATGSGVAVKALRAGSTEIAMLARALLDNERDLFAFHLARDGVAVLAYRDNPVRGVNTRQLKGLLTGELRNWKALGGRDEPVTLGWRTNGQGSTTFILEHLNLKREQIGPHVRLVDNDETVKFVATHPNAVAIASIGEAERKASGGAAIKLLAYEGVPASSRTLQNRSYALSRPLTLLTRELPQGVRKQFIDFALSTEVNDLLRKHGFVPYQE